MATDAREHATTTIAKQLHSTLAGTWRLIQEGDNFVFCDGERVAKIARFPDGAERLQTGLSAAATCSSAGVDVVQPLTYQLLRIGSRHASLWPYVAHKNVGARNMTYDDGVMLGQTLAKLTRMPAPGTLVMDPFG